MDIVSKIYKLIGSHNGESIGPKGIITIQNKELKKCIDLSLPTAIKWVNHYNKNLNLLNYSLFLDAMALQRTVFECYEFPKLHATIDALATLTHSLLPHSGLNTMGRVSASDVYTSEHHSELLLDWLGELTMDEYVD